MQHESDRLNWQGSQIPYIGFDELTHFTEEQFFYMLSRNRSTIGIKPYIRATTNPDADSWVADFIAWWIDQDEESPTYGLALPERAGIIRYFIRQRGKIIWGDTFEELIQYLPQEMLKAGIDPRVLIKSVTFIPASVYDNKALLKQNPEYLGNLLSLALVERERLLGGNWKVKASSGNIFNKDWFIGKIVKAAPANLRVLRYWDKAGTDEEENARAAHTAGVKVGRSPEGLFYVMDVQEFMLTSLKRERQIRRTAVEDGYHTRIWLEQEPGSGGKESAENSVRGLAGYHVKVERVTGDKVARAMPASAQCEAGNVYLVEAEWNRAFIQQLHAFPDARLKDVADAFAGAINKLARLKSYDLKNWPTSSR
jgi:predicted phage terminase large subunit-like protein